MHFVAEGLLDPAAPLERLRHLVPHDRPSGHAGFVRTTARGRPAARLERVDVIFGT